MIKCSVSQVTSSSLCYQVRRVDLCCFHFTLLPTCGEVSQVIILPFRYTLSLCTFFTIQLHSIISLSTSTTFYVRLLLALLPNVSTILFFIFYITLLSYKPKTNLWSGKSGNSLPSVVSVRFMQFIHVILSSLFFLLLI